MPQTASLPRPGQGHGPGGWTGSLTFTGPVSPFLPLLKAGTLVGVGRKLTYGLGRFSLF
ncbi:MAG: CRISPR system precrRNA processing endoribonuclease RAMP protein Cas6 [Desulfobacteraceae bacterium]|nr:CRISPR system precrRNA processing endoribonuclease RAMP protein Cas6 [Desulfobacteraceae bacterium]